jgi:CheY-like chemotaxis protein
MRDERARCISAGCDDHLTKPVDRQILIQKVKAHLQAAASPVVSESVVDPTCAPA